MLLAARARLHCTTRFVLGDNDPRAPEQPLRAAQRVLALLH